MVIPVYIGVGDCNLGKRDLGGWFCCDCVTHKRREGRILGSGIIKDEDSGYILEDRPA
jgi:hypothetical protein